MDLQWPAGQGFAYHIWMNAILLRTHVQKYLEMTFLERKGGSE